MKPTKDKDKMIQEKFQAILSSLLLEDDNKYCADCDAKGPRWASWNLGVFLCIRCAGIHRNLGVHISRVKSVNLDSWTAEQVSVVKALGNNRARQAYEANLPANFRRPQTDSALEQFIRSKYEHKRYLLANWHPPKPSGDQLVADIMEQTADPKKKIKVKPESTVSPPKPLSGPEIAPNNQKKSVSVSPNRPVADKVVDDLLGLNLFNETASNNQLIGSNCVVSNQAFSKNISPSTIGAPLSNVPNNVVNMSSASAVDATSSHVVPPQSSAISDLLSLDAPVPELNTTAGNTHTNNMGMTKDSIMALYNQPSVPMPVPSQQPMFPFPPPFAASNMHYSSPIQPGFNVAMNYGSQAHMMSFSGGFPSVQSAPQLHNLPYSQPGAVQQADIQDKFGLYTNGRQFAPAPPAAASANPTFYNAAFGQAGAVRSSATAPSGSTLLHNLWQ